jgi:predicted dehydrogenase
VPTPLRIGLIGAGRMGRSHAIAIAADPGAELVAIADPVDTTLAVETGARLHDSHAALLEHGGVDAVIIANPNDQHVPTTLDVLSAGVPALLEKPVGIDIAEVRRLADAVDRSGVPVLVGHHRRHHPLIQQAHHAIGSGSLGRVVAITALWLTRKQDEYFDGWRRRPGAGVLLINLVHDLDALRHLCGEITAIQAVTSNAVRGFEVEDTAGLLLEFESGAIGTLTGSDAVTAPWGWDQNAGDDPQFAEQPDQPSYFIAGTHGSLTVPKLQRWTYPGQADWRAPLTSDYLTRPRGGSLQNQLQHFIRVARHQEAPIVSVADAGRSLAAVEAAQSAARTRTRATPQSIAVSHAADTDRIRV